MNKDLDEITEKLNDYLNQKKDYKNSNQFKTNRCSRNKRNDGNRPGTTGVVKKD